MLHHFQFDFETDSHEAQVKNDRGNLPLHSAASFRAPVEVIESLLEAYPEAASLTNNYGNLALHFTAWKKGPIESEKLLLKVFPEGAAQKNNHGNLPLHYAAHYNAPLEVVEALYNAYPEGAHQKNNDNNTPLDLAIADGASPNVVALLRGQSVPPTDDEVLEAAKSKCERMEKELQRSMEQHDGMKEDRESVMEMLLDIVDKQPHALYSAGMDPTQIRDMETLLDQVRQNWPTPVGAAACKRRFPHHVFSHIFQNRSAKPRPMILLLQESVTKKLKPKSLKTVWHLLMTPSKVPLWPNWWDWKWSNPKSVDCAVPWNCTMERPRFQ